MARQKLPKKLAQKLTKYVDGKVVAADAYDIGAAISDVFIHNAGSFTNLYHGFVVFIDDYMLDSLMPPSPAERRTLVKMRKKIIDLIKDGEYLDKLFEKVNHLGQ